jgi:2-polyprenyl-3-methyl-5-hydroxy-6-metoxy-1,4-benzoquinol methylase
MMSSDDENLELASSQKDVDSLNKRFYGRFPYPWAPISFPVISDAELKRTMLNQSVGAWNQDIIPRAAKIWVAGCGTNQAIYAALNFPDASIVASDISTSSLQSCKKMAEALGLQNIRIREESLNEVKYEGEFDYIICTGVVHHNAEPATPLTNIARALKATGVLELMVYNRFHRSQTTNVQKAVRIFSRAASQETDFDEEFRLAKAIITTGPFLRAIRERYTESSDAEFADAWLQPVEHSYTVESLELLAARCGLRLLLPCLNQFDYASNRTWDVSFSDSWLQTKYDNLTDRDRWRVTNLLLGKDSPMLWFYLRKDEVQYSADLERTICYQFLQSRFEKVSTTFRNYVKRRDGSYELSAFDLPYPQPSGNTLVAALLKNVTPRLNMEEAFLAAGLDPTDRKLVNEMRVFTTTPLCSHLRLLR